MMRLRLVHMLSLVLVVFVFTALAAFGGLLAWNLIGGLPLTWLRRDTNQLERLRQSSRTTLGRTGMALRAIVWTLARSCTIRLERRPAQVPASSTARYASGRIPAAWPMSFSGA